MKLAELIRKALTDPVFRLAIEAGTLSTADTGLSPSELAAASEVLRYSRCARTKKLLPGIGAEWREGPQ